MRLTWVRVFTFALVAKVLLASFIPLSNDEAYYWVWSHHLQWSYYDHPAAVAWLFWIGHILEPVRSFIANTLGGPDLTGLVRIPAVIAGHATLLVVRKIIGDSITEKQHVGWLCVLIASPFLGLGSLIVTPDIPLMLTWALAMLALKNYLEDPSIENGAFLGAAVGAGFCAKYHIVLFVPIAVLFVLRKRQWRLLRPAPLIAAIFLGLLFSAPVWGWNAANDWVSFRFQISHGLTQEAASFSKMFDQFTDYALAQAGLLSPLVIFTIWKFNEPKKIGFMRWFGWGPILFFAWTSLRSPVEANWPIAGHLPLLVLASINDTKRYLSRAMITFWTLASVIVIYQGFHPAQSLFGIPAENLKTNEFIRFQPLEAEAKSNPDLFASSYQMAGALSIAANRTVGKLAGINRVDFFDFNSTGHPQDDTFTVAMNEAWPWPAWIAERGYKEVPPARTVGKFTLVTFKREPIGPAK